PEGSRRPANRVAVQYVDGARPDLWGDQPGAFVLLLPEGMTDNDKGVLFAALSCNIAVYVDQQRVRTRLTLHVAADEFWPNPRPGLVRLWRPVPAAVAESRRQPRRSTGERWTLRDAAYLALGYVFRDRLEANPRDYHQVVDRARTSGMNVIEAHLIADSRTARYVHKVPENLVTQPFSATIDLGDMVSARTVLAIGQSRHLGGGLLVPVDVPPEQVGARRG
ncbi:MAG: type I-U CRISPR-associated protein Csb2, partial [Propionicimonas sp.]|nr:type I-U CRISPR-associated protein Csb2 [Propionicimonas sp.]